MISQARIDELRQLGGIDWITVLKSASIKELIRKGTLQPRRFDDANPFGILHPDFPGERLVACRNERLAALRAHTREAHPQGSPKRTSRRWLSGSTEGTLAGEAEIALRIGEQINHYKMKKHFEWQIAANRLHIRRKQGSLAQEAALDGIYVIRTSLPEADMTTADCVRNYKALTLRGARIPFARDGEPPGSPHPPSRRGPGPRPLLSLHARLLRRMAHARCLE